MKHRQDSPGQSQGTRPPERRRRACAAALLTIAACLLALVAGGLLGAGPASATGVLGLPPDPLMTLAIQQAQLTAGGDGAAGDWFGFSVALSGDTALVGAPYDSVDANDYQGSAHVFVRSGTTWSEQQRLTATDGAAGDEFGTSVALAGDTALVGARYDDVGTNESQGSAYVFTRSDTIWSQQDKLTAGDGAANDWFGYSVALSGDTALVGAPLDNVVATTDQGSAYVFTRSGTIWSQQQLTAGDGLAGDNFGISVALAGDTALVGAFADDVDGKSNQGSAYVFVRSGTTWSQQQQLTATGGGAGDSFGISVALAGDTALVGARFDDVGANTDQGSAYVFVRSGTTWTEQQQLIAGDGAARDEFGCSVALAGETALVGAYHDDVANTDQGSAYVYARSGTSWGLPQKLSATDGAVYDYFGWSVALSGETALAGAYGGDVGTNADQGSAYVLVPDFVAPTTAASLTPPANAAGWHNSAVTLTLSASDDPGGSGLDTTYYRFGSSGPFSEYDAAAKPLVTAEGTTTVEYYSTDAAGNSETAKSVVVTIDTTAPSTTAMSSTGSAIPSGWSTSPVTALFLSSDALSGTSGGAAKTEYSTDGGSAWSTGTSATISAQGTTSLLYRSLDAAGNVETAKSATVRIDSAKPTTKAFKASVKKGKKVKLAYQVSDAVPGSGQANVTLKIYKGAKLKKTIAIKGAVACNAKKTFSWKCTLPKGAYTLKVYATDLAGNAQSKVGSARLTVK